MPKTLSLKNKYKQHWRATIHDNEQLEPPHVTIYDSNGEKWRWALREKRFLDRRPPPGDIQKEVIDEIKDRWVEVAYNWNEIHPHNPVEIDEELLKVFFELKGWNVAETLKEYQDRIKKFKV